MLTKSNAKAFAVLAIIYDALSEDEIKDLIIEPYLHGSENGFAVCTLSSNRKFAFAASKQSEAIVVYEGSFTEFNSLGNGATPKIAKVKKEFESQEYYKAASYIVKQLKN